MRCLSIDTASALGGTIAQKIGPLTKAQKVAKKNLKIAFPEMGNYEQDKILEKMWDNLGRVCAEISHLDRLKSEEFLKRVKHIDAHYIDQKEFTDMIEEIKTAIALLNGYIKYLKKRKAEG